MRHVVLHLHLQRHPCFLGFGFRHRLVVQQDLYAVHLKQQGRKSSEVGMDGGRQGGLWVFPIRVHSGNLQDEAWVIRGVASALAVKTYRWPPCRPRGRCDTGGGHGLPDASQCHQRGDGQPTASRVSADFHLLRDDAMRQQSPVGGHRVLHRSGERYLRRQAVVQSQDPCLGRPGQMSQHHPVGADRAETYPPPCR